MTTEKKDWQISSAPSSLANDFCTASTSAPFAKWVIRHSLKSLFSCWWLNCRPMTCWPTTSQLTRYLPKAEYLQSKYLVSAFGRSLHSSLGVGQCIIGAQLSHQHEKRLLSECQIIHFAMACRWMPCWSHSLLMIEPMNLPTFFHPQLVSDVRKVWE